MNFRHAGRAAWPYSMGSCGDTAFSVSMCKVNIEGCASQSLSWCIASSKDSYCICSISQYWSLENMRITNE